MIAQITNVLVETIQIYYYLMWITILFSWFPNIDRTNPIVANIYAITEPYLNIFRGIIPPIGMIDISPIFAIFSLNLIQKLILVIGGYAYRFAPASII